MQYATNFYFHASYLNVLIVEPDRNTVSFH